MPIYDYGCSSCGHVVEVIHGINELGPRFCPNCGREGTMRKAFATPAVHFKGSGWAKKDRSSTSAPGRSRNAASSDGASTDGAPADASSADTSSGDTPSSGEASSAGSTARSSDAASGNVPAPAGKGERASARKNKGD
ncbi:MAG: zinc ribbon domain-containing protein [Chloroflexi bacterium]|nr:zinc ribbon domain-containing protein [Chloroflexota bacterium]